MTTKRRIGIVGCGGMGAGHAWALSGRGGYEGRDGYSSYGAGQEAFSGLQDKLELAGIYDIDPQRMEWAKENNFYCYESYEGMLSDNALDMVLIATPNHLHKEMALAAFATGKHVLCEKPVMMSSKELEEVIDAASKAGVVFYPRQNRRWDRDYLIAKKLFEEKTLGNVFRIESCVLGSRGIPGDWRGQKEYGGGMMLDWGVHLLDRLLVMIPYRIDSVYCRLTHVNNNDVDDGFHLVLEYENKLNVHVEVGTCNFITKPLWYLAGDKGTAVIEDWHCNGKLALLESWDDKDAKPILAGEGLTKTMAPRDSCTINISELPDLIVNRDELYMNFVDVVNGEAHQLVTAEESLRVLRLMEAAIKSDEVKGVVKFVY